MAENQIKWRTEDLNRLKKAVNDFNKKIRRLEKEENLLYLPDTITYIDTKNDITTRAEYNRRVKALESFMKEGAEDLHITKGGEGLSKWEWQQTLNQKRILENRLNKEIADYDRISPKVKGLMGNPERVQAEATLESIQKIYNLKGAAFNRVKNRVQNLGVKDYDMRRAETFRKNVLQELREIKYKSKAKQKLYKALKNVRNPIEFYEKVKESDVMYDFFKWYKNPELYGDFKNYDDISQFVLDEMAEFEEFDKYVLSLLNEE